MRSTKRYPGRLRLLSIAGVVLVLLTACKGDPAPAPTSTPGPPASAEWIEHETDQVRISLPADWDAPAVTPDAVDERFAAFGAANPDLAGRVGREPTALQEAHFWGFAPAEAGFSDSLVIIAAPTAGEPLDADQVLADVAAQQTTWGYAIREQQPGLEIDGRPASRIIYAYDMVDSNQTAVTVEAHQYFVSDQDALWVLTFTIRQDHATEMAPVVDRSASSFQIW